MAQVTLAPSSPHWGGATYTAIDAHQHALSGVGIVTAAGTGPTPPAAPPPSDAVRRVYAAYRGSAAFQGVRPRRTTFVAYVPPAHAGLPHPQRLPLTIAAHFTPGAFAGRAPRRVGVGPVPAPPAPQLPAGIQRRMQAYAAHFTPPDYPGPAQPRRGRYTYSGGAGLPARASQIVAEALVSSPAGARASQVILEALNRNNAGVRASQIVAEALYQQSNPAYVRASQIVIEVLVPYLETPVIPVYPQLVGLNFDYVKRVKTSVGRGVGSSGREIAVNYWSNPQWEWDLSYDILADTFQNVGTTAADIKTLVGFVLAVQGSFSPFYFCDPDDNQVTGQAIGVGDGVTTQFTLVRTYGLNSALGDFQGTEPIGGINTNEPVNIYLEGVAQTTGFAISTSTPYGNTVTFTTAPAAGVSITADFNFYYFCRIMEDSTEFSKFMKGLWALKKITLFSLKN